MTKRTNPKKLMLTSTTVRDLSRSDLAQAAGGTSVGTCTACRLTYNPHCTALPKTIIWV